MSVSKIWPELAASFRREIAIGTTQSRKFDRPPALTARETRRAAGARRGAPTPSRPSAERGGLDGVRRRLPETSAPMVSCAAGFSEPSGSLKPSCSGGSHLRPFDRTPSTAPSPIGSDRNGTGSSRRRAPQSTWAHVHSLATHPRRFPHACRLLTLAPSRAAGLAGASLARALAFCSVSPASIATAHSSPSARRCSRPPVRWRPAACSCGGGEAAPALAAG